MSYSLQMQFKIPHRFSKQEAVIRVNKRLQEIGPQLAGKATIDEERWEGSTLHFAFTAEGQHISGSLVIKDKEFDVTATLPLMMRLFEGKIQRVIEEQVKLAMG